MIDLIELQKNRDDVLRLLDGDPESRDRFATAIDSMIGVAKVLSEQALSLKNRANNAQTQAELDHIKTEAERLLQSNTRFKLALDQLIVAIDEAVKALTLH
jgi:hypothetical protein